MLSIFSENQSAHAPLRELNNGDWMDFAESPARLRSILDKIPTPKVPEDHGMEPILAVHDAAYVDFLQSAHKEWLDQGREGDAIGYAFPVRGRRALNHDRIDARLGQYGFDAASPISAGTYHSAYWAVQSALSALDAIIAGQTKHAFALCRPPGRHSGRDYFGGYCYLNNAAIAAAHLTQTGWRVAILDIDVHHGNGTQDIFYEDGGVVFASIHADPKSDYPYFWGHADETGAGEGEGATFNQPLPQGTTWKTYGLALNKALERITAFGAKTVIVSYGADTFEEDPISEFKLTTKDMHRIGAAIRTLDLPTLTVMEGGYRIDALGKNVEAYLAGLEAG